MKAVKIISTVIAAGFVAGGISVAVAQNVMPRTPEQDTGTKKDIEATGAMRPMSPRPTPATAAPAPTTSAAPMSSSTDTSSAAPATAEPAAQPTRG
ncbi:MAG: hypothetical protein JWN73_2927 [Betaproteobacteria bacterium]|nr:hypothetical protein [Betaproteobacteria bacterium]